MRKYANLDEFNPNLYTFNVYNFSGASLSQVILKADKRRIWFSVRLDGVVVIPFPMVYFDGFSPTSAFFPILDDDVTIFRWHDYYTLIQQTATVEIGVGPYNIQVVEQLVNQSYTSEVDNATGILTAIEQKLANFNRRRSRAVHRPNPRNNSGKQAATKPLFFLQR